MRILAVNCGSSSLRLDLFEITEGGPRRQRGERHEGAPRREAIDEFLAADAASVQAVAHRVVHGGKDFVAQPLL